MLTQIIKQPSVRGISAGAIATTEIPTTGTHHVLYLRCLTAAGVALTAAQIKADIGDIIIRLNGEQIIEASSTFLLDRQKYYGDAISADNVAGIIPIYFIRPHLPTHAGRAVTALGMLGMDSFTVDVKVTAVAQLASIEVLSEVDSTSRRLGQHIRVAKHPQSFATTGLQEISSIPRYGNDVAFMALHIEKNAGTFEKVTVKLGGNALFEDIDPNLNQVLLEAMKRTPQAAYFSVDFAKNNDLLALLPMAGVQDFRQQITWKTAAPTTFNIYSESIHGLNVRK